MVRHQCTRFSQGVYDDLLTQSVTRQKDITCWSSSIQVQVCVSVCVYARARACMHACMCVCVIHVYVHT